MTTPAFMLVPFMSILFGLHPVSISFDYVFAATLYFVCVLSIQYYVHKLSDLMLLWRVSERDLKGGRKG